MREKRPVRKKSASSFLRASGADNSSQKRARVREVISNSAGLSLANIMVEIIAAQRLTYCSPSNEIACRSDRISPRKPKSGEFRYRRRR